MRWSLGNALGSLLCVAANKALREHGNVFRAQAPRTIIQSKDIGIGQRQVGHAGFGVSFPRADAKVCSVLPV